MENNLEDMLHTSLWRQTAIDKIKLKTFLTASRQSDTECRNDSETEDVDDSNQASIINGSDVKTFYEDICEQNLDDCVIDKEVTVQSNCTVAIPDSDSSFSSCIINKAFNFAQNNNAVELQKLLSQGLSVNTKDNYGWSLLMCCSCSGATECVKLLLKQKARIGCRDNKGNTAIYLASKHGHQHIVEILINHRKSKSSDSDSDDIICISVNETTEFFCDTCQLTIKNTSKHKHESSIVHQFSKGPTAPKTYYGIPSSNKGFQLMVNQGWDENKGLGPQGTGHKFPVKTVLKRDREGLGLQNNKLAKVTHFSSGDVSSIRSDRVEKESTVKKRKKERMISKDKNFERRLRNELNSPDL